MNQDLRYPIGRATEQGYSLPLEATQREKLICDVEELPARLRAALEGLSQEQLEEPYREGGWTVRQTVHHVADSHVNAYSRFRLALTEEQPRIFAYNEAAWAQLADAREERVEVSLALLAALHRRWVTLLRSLREEDWQRSYDHPEMGPCTLERVLLIYAWHGRHHTAHITKLRERKGWN